MNENISSAGPSSVASGSSNQAIMSPSLRLIDGAQLIKQGAEAKVYVLTHLFPAPTIYQPSLKSSALESSINKLNLNPTTTQSDDISNDTSVNNNLKSMSEPEPEPQGQAGPSTILKYRFPKTYRHPTLDSTLTRTRISSEARALNRCLRQGVVVPKVLFVDEKNGILGLERIDGWSVREVLGGGAEGETEFDEEELELGLEYIDHDSGNGELEDQQGLLSDEVEHVGMKELKELGVSISDLMKAIGDSLSKLHLTTIIHGDLTTSNMMIRLTPASKSGEKFEIVIIDFGLSSNGTLPEHYAVDLYVLERAFASTHPASEGLYAGVLEAYAKGLGEKKWKPIETKLKEVRRRGRKRDMTG